MSRARTRTVQDCTVCDVDFFYPIVQKLSMSNIEVTRTIDQPAARVWELLADFQSIAAWNPNLSASYLLDGSQAQGVGASRQCDLADGKNWIRERITDWKEGESYSIDIFEGTMPLASASATLGVRPLGPDRSEAFMRFDYVPKMGVVGRVLDVVVMRKTMTRNINNVLDGLEQGASKAA